MYTYNGIGNLSRLSVAKSRSISAENFSGEKGKGAMAIEGTGAKYAKQLGEGWKISPSVILKGNETFELADINSQGVILHIWLTCDPSVWRSLILRMYWDDEAYPSVQAPVGDFFLNGWCVRSNVNSLPVAVNPAGGMNCFFEMPFRKRARITVENLSAVDTVMYYQIDYALTSVPDDLAYFHAFWNRTSPLEYRSVYTILDNVTGKGHYIGTYLAWQVNSNGWWGEGEIKFYFDGDDKYPTICGTGTEDYFGGAWNWEQPKGQYCTYSTPYMGMHQVIKPDGLYNSQQRFGMYRWHIIDPIRFENELKVTIQALGWRSDWSGEREYLPLKDDIASVAYWYQTEPHNQYVTDLSKEILEVI